MPAIKYIINAMVMLSTLQQVNKGRTRILLFNEKQTKVI